MTDAKMTVIMIGDFTGETVRVGKQKLTLNHAAIIGFPSQDDARKFAKLLERTVTVKLPEGK